VDKILNTFSYGICVFSLNHLQSYLKKEKIRTKKVLLYLQNNPAKYLESLKEGVWIPIVGIDAGKYIIRVNGYDPLFDDEWSEKFVYNGFNLEIKDGFWVTDTESLEPFDVEKYKGCDEVSYQIEALIKGKIKEITVYSGFKYDVPSGKYLISIKGYKRKEEMEFPTPNYGFLFSLTKVDEFCGCNNPREDELYDFNVADM
jgi:hypothetical protein